MTPDEPKSTDACMFWPLPSSETTVPRPNVSWVTRSPGSSEGMPDMSADRDTERELNVSWRRDVADGVDGSHCVGGLASRRQSTSSSGTSSRNRDAGLYEGAPQADRLVARVR